MENQKIIEQINSVMMEVKNSKLDDAARGIILFALEQGGLEIQCIEKKLMVDCGGESLLEYQFPGCEWKFRSLLGRLCEISREAPQESFVGNTVNFTADVALLAGVEKIFRVQLENVPEQRLLILVQRIDYEEDKAAQQTQASG